MPSSPLSKVLESALPALADRREQIERALDGLDRNGLWWLSGYAAGLANAGGVEAMAAPGDRVASAQTLSIVYGSQTGNARRVAETLRDRAQSDGLSVRLLRASDYGLKQLAQERCLVLAISTHGDGDPPDDARELLEALLSARAPAVTQLNFAVLGLGDSSYPKFCHVARLIDARLAALGARRLQPLAECDVDVETVAASWRDSALSALKATLGSSLPLATVTPIRVAAPSVTRDRPFAATLLTNQRLTAADARKDVRHLELSLAGSGIRYQPGDSLGVWPQNPSDLVEQVLAAAALDGDCEIEYGGRSLALRSWLRDELEITRISRKFIATHAALVQDKELNRRLAPGSEVALADFLATHQLIDVLLDWPAPWQGSELVAALRPLTPRLYSIASSQDAVGDEAHLTVAVLDFQARGRRHQGCASSFLAQLQGEAATARVYVESNERFRLPTDATRDIIMIGPGTGVAPFRAFVQQRAEQASSGRNWLFFGEQHLASQFHYQTEWQDALKRGRLQRLDVAFSRDTEQKVYVQQRLRENAAELYRWIEGGAHIYVCGDSTRMAPDVHAALVEIISTHRQVDADAAKSWLDQLSASGRYQRDVY